VPLRQFRGTLSSLGAIGPGWVGPSADLSAETGGFFSNDLLLMESIVERFLYPLPSIFFGTGDLKI